MRPRHPAPRAARLVLTQRTLGVRPAPPARCSVRGPGPRPRRVAACGRRRAERRDTPGRHATPAPPPPREPRRRRSIASAPPFSELASPGYGTAVGAGTAPGFRPPQQGDAPTSEALRRLPRPPHPPGRGRPAPRRLGARLAAAWPASCTRRSCCWPSPVSRSRPPAADWPGGCATPARRWRSAPLIGDDLRGPFDGAGDAADSLAAAGTSQVEAVRAAGVLAGADGRRGADPGDRGGLPAAALAVRPRGHRRTAVHRRRRGPRPVRAAGAGPPADAPAGAGQRRPGRRLAATATRHVVRELAVLELRDVGLAPPAPELSRSPLLTSADAGPRAPSRRARPRRGPRRGG